MIRNHISSSFGASRVEVVEEEGPLPDGIHAGDIPHEFFNMDVDSAIRAESIFGLVEKTYRDEGFSCDRVKEHKGLDGSILVHLEVRSAKSRARVIMLRDGSFFSLFTSPLG